MGCAPSRIDASLLVSRVPAFVDWFALAELGGLSCSLNGLLFLSLLEGRIPWTLALRVAGESDDLKSAGLV